ncbi:MAG TPA: hypothetical protein VGB87_15185, partial [Vicinamibacteria bacterium]
MTSRLRPKGGALLLAVSLILAGTGCRREVAGSGSGSDDPIAEARALVDARRFDEAIARLGDGADAESLYLLGRAWAGRAETAPVPPPVPGSPPGAPRPLKPEEASALACFERAVAARPDHAAAHLAMAQ